MPLDAPVFDDAPIPDETPVLPTDEAPSTVHELHCEVCGIPLSYSGRGRKPKFCDEHKKKAGSSSGKAATRPSRKNSELAAAATESLVQINSLVAAGAMLAQFQQTASAMAAREDAFRTQAFAALQTDPALCQQILRAGQTSARMSLLLAYVSLGASVAPYAIAEAKERRAIKE